ncbi:unnamed protein product [Owenia fusiformis]|uniref:KY-like immunoglobulin-like domain-containing protein n=1 Tax=Owenia fusiformis TaxID=6347 RepID=A0A8S4QCZ6_OWEFU|nr:unnamed protein product [Owenia fusiformis]
MEFCPVDLPMPTRLLHQPLIDVVDTLTRDWNNTALKIRAIFTWLATQNTDDIDPKDDNGWRLSPLMYLARVKMGSESYSELFKDMCSLAHINCEVVEGDVKGHNYQPGDVMTTKNRRFWNVVQLGDDWKLLDAYMASRQYKWRHIIHQHMVVSMDDNENVKRDEDCMNIGYYFFTEAPEFITTHFPYDSKWQLLTRQITAFEFETLAYVTPHFYFMGWQLMSHQKCAIHTDTGEIDIVIQTPSNESQKYWINLSAISSNTENVETLERHVFVDRNRTSGVLKCSISLPKSGEYKLNVYGKTEMSQLELCVAYKLHNDAIDADIKAHTLCVANELRFWGPCFETDNLNINPLGKAQTSRINEKDGLVQMEFSLANDMPLDFTHELISATDTGETNIHHQYSVHEVRKNALAIFYVQLPFCGKFAFRIFAKQKLSQGALPLICCYLISCDDPAISHLPFPKFANGRVGITDEGTLLGTQILAFDTPIISNESGVMEIEIKTNPNCIISASMKLSKNQNMENGIKTHNAVDKEPTIENGATAHIKDSNHTKMDEFTFIKYVDEDGENGTRLKVGLRCPLAGQYHLALYGYEDAQTPRMSIPNVCNFVINSTTNHPELAPFPKCLASWGKDFELLCPTHGMFYKDQTIPVVLRVPNATAVALSGQRWVDMVNVVGTTDLWLEQIRIDGEGDVTVCAKLGDSEEYKGLLKFKVSGEPVDHDEQILESIGHEFEKAKEIIKVEQREYMEQRATEAQNEIENEQDVEIDTEKVEENKNDELDESVMAVDAIVLGLEGTSIRLLEEAIRRVLRLKDSIDNHQTLINKANLRIRCLTLERELLLAMRRRQLGDLESLLETIEKEGHHKDITEYPRAHHLLGQLKRIKVYQHAVLDLDAKTMSELRGYRTPHTGVHNVMIASLLLLRSHEGESKVWNNCQRLLQNTGQNGIMRRLKDLDFDDLHIEIVLRVREILERTSLDDVKAVSAGAAAFFIWAKGMADEARSKHVYDGIDVTTLEPANVKRQQEIFNSTLYDKVAVNKPKKDLVGEFAKQRAKSAFPLRSRPRSSSITEPRACAKNSDGGSPKSTPERNKKSMSSSTVKRRVKSAAAIQPSETARTLYSKPPRPKTSIHTRTKPYTDKVEPKDDTNEKINVTSKSPKVKRRSSTKD